MHSLPTLFLALLSVVASAQPVAEALGHVDGSLHVLSMPIENVREMLPPGLEPAPQNLGPKGTHPVIVFVGVQTDVHFVAGGTLHFPPLIGQIYNEQVLLIPDLVAAKHPGRLFTHAPRMFLDGKRATLAGKAYNFNKRLARFEGDESELRIGSYIEGRPLLSLSRRGRQVRDASAFARNLETVGAWLSQPLYQPGKLSQICSFFDWRLGEAQLWPAPSTIVIEEAFLPGLEPAAYVSPGLDESPHGSFGIRGDWTLSLPRRCSSFLSL
jgi:hypothetical protein